MTSDQKADLLFLFILAPKMQESLDNIQLNKEINRFKLKATINNLQLELEKVVKVLYTNISEEEEQELRDLTTCYENRLKNYKRELKRGVKNG